MSAEVESNKEEEKPVPKRNFRNIVSKEWQLGIKILELILALLCMGFIFAPLSHTGLANSHIHHVGIMYTAYSGSMVIIIGFIIGRILKDKLGYRTCFVFSTINAALYLATGILLTADKSDLTKDYFYHPSRYILNRLIVAILVTFLNALVFIADAILSFINKQDF